MSKRINISVPGDWHAEFRKQAAKEGRSLSEWLCDAGRTFLPKRIDKKLSDRPAIGRPKKESK